MHPFLLLEDRMEPFAMSLKQTPLRLPALLALALAAACVALLLVVLSARAQEPAQPAAPADLSAQADLRINEFMASNQTALSDPDDPTEFPDWIEIYNPTAAAVSLTGLSFSDEAANPAKSPITLPLTIPANGYLIFYADNQPERGPLHLDFALSAGGEEIGLYFLASGVQIDHHEFGPQSVDRSEGRRPDGSGPFVLLDAPSPGISNQFSPPVISNLQRAVQQPQSAQSVNVTAVVTDNGTLTLVSLIYSTTTNSDASLPMTNVAGNTWQATLPGQANGVHVTYKVRAEDDEDNTTETRRNGYVVGYVAPLLVINEMVAANVGQVEDMDDPGEFPDWLEIYNPGAAAVSLNGLSLSDDPNEPARYRIPNGIAVPAKGFVLVYLDEDPEQTNIAARRIHTNFSLAKDGESVGLYGAQGTAEIDRIVFGSQWSNRSLGYFPDGSEPLIELVCTTPGRKNILCDKINYLPVVSR